MSRRRGPERRAAALVSLYPQAWRQRYGVEFEQLLIDQLEERPADVGALVDVVAHAARTRLTYAGVVGDLIDGERRRRTSLFALGGVTVTFLVLGLAIWSQAAVGWEWSAPADAHTRFGMELMSAALIGFAATAGLAALTLGVTLTAEIVRGTIRRWPALAVLAAATAALAIGAGHVGAAWPGTGGHPWPGRMFVPTWPARMGWALTLSISAYWAHPRALGSLTATQLVWMTVSPLLLIVQLAAAARIVGALRPGRRALACLSALGGLAVICMALFVAGACSWVMLGRSGPHGLFVSGTVDLAAVVALSVMLVGAFRLLRRGAVSSPPRPGSRAPATT